MKEGKESIGDSSRGTAALLLHVLRVLVVSPA